ncbi:hypothetical protein [Candidatus Nanohalobium constans]|uniref:Uncharacterized protein n=1 Tax=Candidatus Nanohalobium constans TaxID=2565781 RepID=A0A5Q0UGX0_9ARCH|nr:hypothetical protein [Candidatus Nanohalobium constans]QGA80826.1 hypothetical protein LC1Nh_0944 [Candidatus Nanohalobium constans]
MVNTHFIIGITLTILVTATTLSAYNSIRINTLNPQADKLDQVTGHIGRPDIKISSKNQLKSTVLFNMLAATDCRILTSYAYAERQGENIDIKSNANQLSDINDTAYYSEGLSPAFKHGFSGECAGAGGQAYAVGELVEESSKSAVESLPGGTALANLKNIIGGADREFLEEPGRDMEGMFGKIKFKINKTEDEGKIRIGTNQNSKFIAMKAINPSGNLLNDQDSRIPDFLLGEKTSAFIPAGVSLNQYSEMNNECPDGSGYVEKLKAVTSPKKAVLELLDTSFDYIEGNYPCEAQDKVLIDLVNNPTKIHDGEDLTNPGIDSLYSSRVRIDTGETRRIIVEDAGEFKYETGGNQYRSFLNQAKWYLCEGDEGYIQSNAGTYDNTGEAGSENFVREDRVYPLIKLTESTNCLDRGGPDAPTTNFGVYSTSEVHQKVSCSVEESIAKEKKFTASIHDTSTDYYCGLVPQTFRFDDYSGEVDYYRTGLFAEQDMCPESGMRKNMLDEEILELQAEEYSYDWKGDRPRSSYAFLDNGDLKMRGNHQGGVLGSDGNATAEWNVKDYDNFALTGVIDILNQGSEFTDTNTKESNGQLKFKVNNETVMEYKKRKGVSGIYSRGELKAEISDEYDETELNFVIRESGTMTLTMVDAGKQVQSSFDATRNFHEDHPTNIKIVVKGEKGGDNYRLPIQMEKAILKNSKPAGCE